MHLRARIHRSGQPGDSDWNKIGTTPLDQSQHCSRRCFCLSLHSRLVRRPRRVDWNMSGFCRVRYCVPHTGLGPGGPQLAGPTKTCQYCPGGPLRRVESSRLLPACANHRGKLPGIRLTVQQLRNDARKMFCLLSAWMLRDLKCELIATLD